MSLWTRTLDWLGVEQRRTLKEVDFWLQDSVWGGTTTDAGVSVSPETAIGVPDVYACIQVIAQDVARCPLKYQQRSADGDWYDAEAHEFWDLLGHLPNPETTAVEFWASLIRDVQIYDRAYAEIIRRGTGEPYQLWRLDPSRMTVTRDQLNRKVYTYRPTGTKTTDTVWVFDADRPPLLELSSWSWVNRCKNLIGLAAALDTYGSKYFANAARPSGVLVAPTKLDDAAKTRLAAAWRSVYGGVQNAHKVAVLEHGVEWKSIATPNNEAQFIEARRFVTERICGVAGVPPHKIAELSRSTNNNIEQQSRDYLQRLDPYLVLIEQAVRRDLLTSRTWPRYRAVFDRERLVQTDLTNLANAYATYRQNGIMSVNDIRRKLNENPIDASEGGDLYHMNGNMVPLTGPPAPPVVALPRPVAEAPEADDVEEEDEETVDAD